MTVVLGFGDDYVPAAGARAGELRACARMARMIGRPGRQPAPGLGTPTLLVPGFVSGNVSLTLLVRELRRRGHRTFRSGIGANIGCTQVTVERLVQRLETVAEHEQRPVALVGHSRGGMIAALAARRRPELVAGLITLAAPITGTLSLAPHVRRQLELLCRLHEHGLHRLLATDCVSGDCAAQVVAELAAPFPADLAFTSIYSRADAILDWRTCLDPAAELVEVGAGHVGMATDPVVCEVVAARLSALGAPAALPGASSVGHTRRRDGLSRVDQLRSRLRRSRPDGRATHGRRRGLGPGGTADDGGGRRPVR